MIDALDSSLRERHLPLPGTFNVRDLGGFPTAAGGVTRRGVLFRGDSLHRLDDEARTMLVSAGVRTVVDLRDERERASFPSALPAGVRRVELPLVGNAAGKISLEDGWTLADVYLWFAEQSGAGFAAVARELARPGSLPALVHCMAGKDRTGMVVAIVLSAVGVHEDLVATDFAASATFLGVEEYRREATERALADGLPRAVLDWVFGADPEHLLRALRAIDERHGGCAEYLLAHGLTGEELAALREVLVETPGGA